MLPGEPFDDHFPFEEAAVLQAAVRERVAPLLHRALLDARIVDGPTPAFRGACERLYYGTFRKNAILVEAGRELLGVLARQGIGAAPLKGLAFLLGDEPLYPDPGARPMDDLDLIVRPDEREKACAAFVSRGFRPITGGEATLEGGHELAFHREQAGVDVFVELHWAWAGPESLMREFAVDGGRFLDDFCDEDADGLYRPSWLGHLCFTAVHATRHALDRWIWLVDLHRLITARDTGWDEIVEVALRWRLRRPLYAALLATRELLRTPIPKEALAALAPGPVRRRLLHHTLAASTLAPGPARAGWTAKALLGESWWDVARTAAWAAAPGDAWWARRGTRPSRLKRAAHPLRILLPTPGGD